MATKTKVSPLQIYQSRNFSGLTETNHFSNAYLSQPEKLGSVLAYAFGIQENNVLSLLTGGIGNTRFVNNREYEWDVHTQSERAISIGTDSPNLSDPKPGYGGTLVTLIFSEKVFDSSDVLVADDGQTQVRVQAEPYQTSSGGWAYQVQNTNPSLDA